MQIKALTVSGFMGIKDEITIPFEKVSVFSSPNGTGKTSILSAVRYALTGEKPEGEIVNRGSEEARVSITLQNSRGTVDVFERQAFRGKTDACYYSGQKVTGKALNEMIERFTELPLEKVKTVSSQELVAAMKPKEFGKFILSYIPKKMTREDIKGFIPEITDGMKKIIDDDLPEEDIDIDSLDEFEVLIKGERKDLKARIKENEALLKTLPPACSEEEYNAQKAAFDKRLDEFNKEGTRYSLYLQQRDSYDRFVSAVGRQKKRLAELKEKLKGYDGLKKPDTAVKDSIQKEFDSVKETIINNKAAYKSMAEGKAQLEKTLAAIDKPVCPLSPLITCHEDKAPAKAEIEKSIADMEESLEKLTQETAKAEERKQKLIAEANAYVAEEKKHNEKVSIEQEIKGLETSEVKLPERPAEVKKPDNTAAIADIRKQMSILEEKKKAFNASEQLKSDKDKLVSYEALVKAAADGGVIRKGVLSGYLGTFESFCNGKCEAQGVPYRFMFVYDRGVAVQMTNKHGELLPYQSLSGGEKAFFLYMMISLLNDLCGARLILLDELSVMDAETFGEFLALLKASGDDYDTAVIAAVPHPDTDEKIKEAGITPVEILNKK